MTFVDSEMKVRFSECFERSFVNVISRRYLVLFTYSSNEIMCFNYYNRSVVFCLMKCRNAEHSYNLISISHFWVTEKINLFPKTHPNGEIKDCIKTSFLSDIILTGSVTSLCLSWSKLPIVRSITLLCL